MIAKLPKPLPLFHEIKTLIDSARQRAAVAVNAELTLLYWQVGQRINAEVLKGTRAVYGKELLPLLSKQLTEHYGKGWSQRGAEGTLVSYANYPSTRFKKQMETEPNIFAPRPSFTTP